MTTIPAATSSRVGTLALTGLAPLVWGTTYAVTSEFLPSERPMFTALMRALPVGLLLIAATRRLPHGRWIWRAGLLGVLNIGVWFALLFLAAYRLPGGVAAVLGAATPMFALGFAAMLLRERPTSRKVIAAIIGISGVALVVLRANATLDVIGVAAGLVGAASQAAGAVLTGKWGRPEGVGPVAFTGWQLTAGGLMLLPLALLVEGAPPAMDVPAIGGYLYLGLIGTAAAYVLWFRGLSRMPATSIAFLGLLSPLGAAVIGWAWLGQALSPLQILGIVIALAGTLLAQTGAARKPDDSKKPAVRNVSVTQPAPSASVDQVA
ncbi:EamA family transporter [Nocardia pseudobrasiliensis]|uniref:Putative blue pigment (Indigoidine) exporter n=1 Tax=Nocardia pseudobrasiliensis TaxID=45979 RepID=A0A370HT40_9NOCA|nr:EamA family transporter [Nocardia pseudobrasiliensis]RDI61689.1 putative blue pigment (indigoidine) exporter [Nocardia pseudobrasiliensis]